MEHIFRTHKLNDQGFEKVGNFKSSMKKIVELNAKAMPGSRNKSIFLSKIEEAMFFGTKALAEDIENHTEVIDY